MPEDIEAGSDTSTLPIFPQRAKDPNGFIFQPTPDIASEIVVGVAEPFRTRNTNEDI